MQGREAPKPIGGVVFNFGKNSQIFLFVSQASLYSPWRLLSGPGEQLLAKLGENCPSLTCLLALPSELAELEKKKTVLELGRVCVCEWMECMSVYGWSVCTCVGRVCVC